jgi:regulatory protein
MDEAWLEREALQYVARWEATRRGVETLLERRIRRRCERTGEPPEPALARIGGIVDGLAARDYVNDRRFATQLLERLRREGRSRAWIRLQLRRKGVPDPILRELTRPDDAGTELAAAWRLARRRRLGPFCRDAEQREASRQRHLAVLARQGFSREVACRVVDAADDSEAPLAEQAGPTGPWQRAGDAEGAEDPECT